MGKSYKHRSDYDDEDREFQFEKEDKRLQRALRTKDIDMFYEDDEEELSFQTSFEYDAYLEYKKQNSTED